MPTTVEIQARMSHGLLPVIILFLLCLSPIIVKKVQKYREKKKEKMNPQPLEPVKEEIPLSVKEEYFRRLNGMKTDYKEGRLSSKDGYKLLRKFLRDFVLEYAGVDVTKKTLAEIKRSNIPKVAKLIEEYYVAEFSPDDEGNFADSLNKTIKIINNWKAVESKKPADDNKQAENKK